MRLSYTPRHPTPGQLRVLKALHFQTKANGHPPTIRELCATLGVRSTQAVAQHLGHLEDKGMVEHLPGTARTLRLTARGMATLRESFRGQARGEGQVAQ